jgi:hypothetical protein
MDLIKIKVNNDSLYLNSSNQIIGEIYFEKNGYLFFPEENWSDFVIVILSWWTDKLRYFEYGSNGEYIDFDFMDGPLRIRIERISKGEIKLVEIKENSYNKEVLFKADTHFNVLKSSLLKASKSVLGFVKIKNWETEETLILENKIKSLLY